MTRFSAIFLIALSLATTPTAAAVSISDGLKSIGQSGWVDAADAETCKVARRFEAGDKSLTFVLQGQQLLSGPGILLIEDGSVVRMADRGDVTVSVPANGETRRLQYASGVDPATKRRVTQIDSSQPVFTRLEGAETIRLVLGKRDPVILPTSGMIDALAVLKACQRREAAARGLDLAKLDAIVVPAEPIDPKAGLGITFQNYPPDAFRRGETGKAEATWIIDATGNVRDCRVIKSSGSVSLDAGTCQAILASSRYRPARDAAGKSVDVPMWTSVNWVLGPKIIH